jgi:hypothetical protein
MTAFSWLDAGRHRFFRRGYTIVAAALNLKLIVFMPAIIGIYTN